MHPYTWRMGREGGAINLNGTKMVKSVEATSDKGQHTSSYRDIKKEERPKRTE